VPPRYAFHLEDLRVFHLVRASCHACGHKDVIPNASLLQGRPRYTSLLASAGVVGIAVGFGAQTLVRDLFSGASY
jgi:hypothetical protein